MRVVVAKNGSECLQLPRQCNQGFGIIATEAMKKKNSTAKAKPLYRQKLKPIKGLPAQASASNRADESDGEEFLPHLARLETA